MKGDKHKLVRWRQFGFVSCHLITAVHSAENSHHITRISKGNLEQDGIKDNNMKVNEIFEE